MYSGDEHKVQLGIKLQTKYNPTEFKTDNSRLATWCVTDIKWQRSTQEIMDLVEKIYEECTTIIGVNGQSIR